MVKEDYRDWDDQFGNVIDYDSFYRVYQVGFGCDVYQAVQDIVEDYRQVV